MVDTIKQSEKLTPRDIEEKNSIEEDKGEFFQLKENIIKSYLEGINMKFGEINSIKDQQTKLEEAKKLLVELEEDKIDSNIYMRDLLKLIIGTIEREKLLETVQEQKTSREKANKGQFWKQILKPMKKHLSLKIDELKEDETISLSPLEENPPFDDLVKENNPLNSLVEEENQKIFDIPSSEANHNIIVRYLWKHAEEKDFLLSVDVIKKQLVNNLLDSYRNELLGERKGLEDYLMWEPSLEGVFQNILGALYPYFQGSTLLSFTESRFKPKKNNEYTAGGYFQIINDTAKKVKIKISKHIDERKDPLKSAAGAATHLKLGFNRWYDKGLYYQYKDRINYEQCINYKIVKGDTISSIKNKYQVSSDVILDINQLDPDNLKIGSTIIIPTQESYIITETEREILRKNSTTLALASYNGKIVEDIPGISTYDEYLEKFTELLKIVKKTGDTLVYIKYRTAFENENIHAINKLFIQVINAYQSISNDFFVGKYWKKRIGLLEKYMLADLSLEKKRTILMYLMHSKEEDCTESHISKLGSKTYIKDSLHMKRWFTDILTQNLLYPANLWAMQKLTKSIDSGQDKVLQLDESKIYQMDVVTITDLPNPNNAITLHNIAHELDIDLQVLIAMNPHIKKSVYNLGLNLPFHIYLPQNYGSKMKKLPYEMTVKKLFRRKINVDKTQIIREERHFEKVTETTLYPDKEYNPEQTFQYIVKNYDTIYDISLDLEKQGFQILSFKTKNGETIKSNLNPGEKITIFTKKDQ